MRKFLLLIAVALFSIGTNAQEAIWDASIASVREGSDMPVNSIATIAEDGSLYVAGARDKKFDFANGSVGSLTGGAYVAKYDAEGKELFAVSLAGAMEITAITSDADKNLYVAGVFAEEAFIGEVSGEGQTINGGFGDKYVPYPSAFLAKYDANGNLLTVKSYQASEDATIVDSGLYWGDIVAVSISKIIAEGSKVYVQFNYSGDVTIDTNLSLVAKYVFAYGMAYIDASNIAVVSFDSVLENAVSVASLAVADGGIDVSNVHDFDFAVEDESVYVAAFAAGNVVLSTAESSEAFDFILDDSGNQEEGFIIANIGEDAVKFTNTPCEGLHSYYNTIAGMEVSDGCIYIAGTFNNVLALDNETTAVGASDVFVASVDAATLDVNFVSANANDEGATNQYYGEVSGAVYTAGSVLVYDQIVDMGSYNNSYKNYNVLLSDGTIEEAAEAQPATAVAYNSNYYALINCTDATNISVYSMPAPSTPVDRKSVV